ncbi:sprT-like domain-containing protein Spartan isoform X2 [Pecten maximus]|uniref:sprT-like domain-containing protein Spartan isoform X2 n=1 Tax=Pecten maximus TaxID=6579 RepID=UPI00145913A2|nr:sprT-like domain-containing protein Spartan isoform X2 [Pecten maximus]
MYRINKETGANISVSIPDTDQSSSHMYRINKETGANISVSIPDTDQSSSHMYRINMETGANISVYHTFHDEVESYRQHWWRCTGPCRQRKPYFGYVKRAMNRAPSERDTWWKDHKNSCNGIFEKVKEPEGYGKKKKTSEKSESSDDKKREKGKEINRNMDIRLFGGKGNILSSDGGKNSSVNDTKFVTNNKVSVTNNKVSVTNNKVSATARNGDKIQGTLTGGVSGNQKITANGNKPKVTSTVTSEQQPKTLVNGILSNKVSVNTGATGSRSSTQPGYHDNQVKEASHVTFLDSDEDDYSKMCKPVPTYHIPPGGASSELTSGQENVRSKLREVWAKRFNSASSTTVLPALSRPKKRTQEFEPKSMINPSVAKRCKIDQDSKQSMIEMFSTPPCHLDLPAVESKSLHSGTQKCINSKNVSDSDSQKLSVLSVKKPNVSGKKINNPGKKPSNSHGQKPVIDSNQNTVSGMFSKMRSPEKESNDRVVSLDPATPAFHACPVCTKSVPVAEMNHHLDLCLSL